MYVISMKPDRQYMAGDYVFQTKKECQEFLESLHEGQLEKITEIWKYNKKSSRNAYYDFFVNPYAYMG